MAAIDDLKEASLRLEAKINALQIPNNDAALSEVTTRLNNSIATLDSKFPPVA